MNSIYVAKDAAREEIFGTKYHLAIFASGYEERSTHLSSLISRDQFSETLVFGFLDQKDHVVRKENDTFYNSLGHQIAILEGDVETAIYGYLRASLQKRNPLEKTFVLIDYSSMPRTWYSAILNFFRHFNILAQLDFVYSIGEHLSPPQERVLGLPFCLPGCDSHYVNSRRRVAIFGLGFEEMPPIIMCEKLEPDEVFALIAKPSALPNYADKVLQTHDTFIENYVGRESNLLYSSIHSVQDTLQTLLEVCYPFFDTSTITLLPFGPKPHVLACVLMASNFGPISCLYSRSASKVCSVIPTGELVATSVELKHTIKTQESRT